MRCSANLGLALSAAFVPQGGQLFGTALPGHDGPDDGHPGLAGNVGDRPVYLHVHLVECLLHPLHRILRTFFHQISHLALQRTKRTDLFGRVGTEPRNSPQLCKS